MATILETPSRIWRRIEAIEHRDMPSLPSLPPFEDSGEEDDNSQSQNGNNSELINNLPSPLHSTPTVQNIVTSGYGGSGSSTARYTRSTPSIKLKRSQSESLDISSLLEVRATVASADSDEEGIETRSSVPEAYLPPEDEHQTSVADFSLPDALESMSTGGSPPLIHSITEDTSRKNHSYAASLGSEPKPSPLEKYRHVALRKTNPRARTPSLSRSSSSDTSSSGHSTPQTNRSLTLPQSQSNSPPQFREIHHETASLTTHESLQNADLSHLTQETRSMDITDVHVSPPRLDGDVLGPDEIENPEGQSQRDEYQPTFSSESGLASYAINSKEATINTSNVTQSTAFTPTPAFPRQRPRFNLPPPPADLLSTPVPRPRSGEDGDQTTRQGIVPATPYSRPSFLLSVINSTTRPRMKAGTPFPRRQGTPSIAESTPAADRRSGNESTPSTSPRPAFAGVTRRPRIALAPRMSHPLTQAISSAPSPESEPALEGADMPWATPSPYDSMTDKASFISTASSHDLTTHQRVNTSFDPAMGFGAGAIGRFNANKLNTYLHGLNRRLQEENEALVERLKELEEERKASGGSKQETESSSRRLSRGSRRRSSAATALGDLKEDLAEGWLEEKAELEEIVETLQAEAKIWVAEKEEMERNLQHEMEERDKDKLRWKERMMEAQEDVVKLVTNLENQIAKSEEEGKITENEASQKVKQLEKALMEVEGEREIATERALKAEKLLEEGKELGGALADANKRIAEVLRDLKCANLQIKGLEDEVMLSESRADELEKVQKDQNCVISGLEAELAHREDSISADRATIRKLEEVVRQTDQQLHETKSYVEGLEQGINEAGEEIRKLAEELATAEETIDRMKIVEQQNLNDIRFTEKELQAVRERGQHLEEVVEEAQKKMTEDQEIVLDLKNRLASLERERSTVSSHDTLRSSNEIVYTAAEYEALEQELDDANKEKARLQTLLDQSPARKAIEKAKDLKIELLEREKEELLERNRSLRTTMNEISTPNKITNASGISPIHRHVLNMSIRMPKTPGAPLRDMSWLNSTQRDASMTPLLSEIQRLQGELDRANESIDDKLDRLEHAGLDVVGMTQKLEDARTKIIALEEEIAFLRRKEDRRIRRFARVRCQKCHTKLRLESITLDDNSMTIPDDTLPTEPPTPPTKTSEALRDNLQTVNKHLVELKKQWELEKTRLLGEKAVLEDKANRLNNQIKTTKTEAQKAAEGTKAIAAPKSDIQDELGKAKETIAVLEKELGSERSRLRSMANEQGRMQREKNQILTNMKRTESDIEDVKQQMQKLKQENQKLEKELRENAVAEQKARLFEARVSENTDTIEQLRQERSMLAVEHKDLQRRFQEATEVTSKLRDTCSSLTKAHDNRRQELDLHRQEIDDLRKALEERQSDLRRVQREKAKVSSEKENVARTVTALEADLQRVKRDAEAFGRDLKTLRAEKDLVEAKSKDEIAKAERAKIQAQTQIRILNEQLTAEKERARRVDKETSAMDGDTVAALKQQHNKECKGLMVQIRYLKSKFTRESLFRDDLTYQKQYLMVLLQQFETSERNILAAIARIGFPALPPPPPRRRPKFKSVGVMLVFLSRLRKSSDSWKQEGAAKKLLSAALEDVRKRRATKVE